MDPGEEAERILQVDRGRGPDVEAILLTHTHFDHVGAVAPVAKATGAPVYCPKLETMVLADIMSFVPWPGFGPYESCDAEETVEGGEHLELAGLEIDVIFTPGHSPGHVTYATEDALFSGDVLFQSSIGRTDLPGGDYADADALDRAAARQLSRRDPGLPGAHGHDDARRRAHDEPVPRRPAGVSTRPQAPRGTFDVLPEQASERMAVENVTRRILEGAGYRRIETPTFEHTELFARGVGESTDIVQKEMYTFEDGGDRSLRCARRGRRRSAAPTSSTGCTSSRSR